MRLEGRMRLGYYPLDNREAERIRKYLQFPAESASALRIPVKWATDSGGCGPGSEEPAAGVKT